VCDDLLKALFGGSMLRLKLPENLTDCESLSRTFGFAVPNALISYLRALSRCAGGDSQMTEVLFELLTGLMLDGTEARYQQTPPEFFPFASLGVDGMHYGYVIHDPQSFLEDYPVGEICPMDRGGVCLVGRGTKDALENLATEVICEGVRDPEKVLHLCRKLGLEPDEEKAEFRYGADGDGLPIIPDVPSGWIHVASADGIGVLAPSEQFDPKMARTTSTRSADELLSAAEQAFLEDFPASALYYLREGYWYNWTNNSWALRFSGLLQTVYTALDRPRLAEVVEWRADKFFRENEE
jgi:hypothetical protein